jgi:hypothetical protein
MYIKIENDYGALLLELDDTLVAVAINLMSKEERV